MLFPRTRWRRDQEGPIRYGVLEPFLLASGVRFKSSLYIRRWHAGDAIMRLTQPFHRKPRMTLQKFIGQNVGSLSASTSAFTLPNVVSGFAGYRHKSLDAVLFQVLSAGICGNDSFAISTGKFRVGDSENVHLNTVVNSATTGYVCGGIPGVVCNAIAVHTVSISCSGDIALAQDCPRAVRAIHFEAVRLTAMARTEDLAGLVTIGLLSAPHLASIVCSLTQAHTAFFSVSVSFASGCMEMYGHGGILPVDMSPQMDSNLSRLCHRE
jgi:hypothetical protein